MKFYRIQPAGLGCNHKSEDSAGEFLHLHVFQNPVHLLHAEGRPDEYGDEVVQIEAEDYWENGDVEGVAIDGSKATITHRWTLEDFAKWACPQIAGLTEEEIEEIHEEYSHWDAAKKIVQWDDFE